MTELELILAAQSGDLAARDALVTRYTSLVWSRANRRTSDAQLRADLFQAGIIGLLHAIDVFDSDRADTLYSMAFHHIDNAITLAKRDETTMKLPRNGHSRRRRRDELGDYDGTRLDKSRSRFDVEAARRFESLDEPLFDGTNDTLEDRISSATPTPEDEIQASETLARLKSELCGMDARMVASLLRGDETLASVGKRFGITRERVRQLEAQGMDRLRRHREALL